MIQLSIIKVDAAQSVLEQVSFDIANARGMGSKQAFVRLDQHYSPAFVSSAM